MVLAAGRGERMRPLTERMPKPLVPVAGKPLLDHVLDRLASAGVERAVVNVHYLAGMIEDHLRGRSRPQIAISDERDKLLDTGGGVVKALPAIGAAPFFHLNSDTIWIDGVKPNLERLAEGFDAGARWTRCCCSRRFPTSIGYAGRGDFTMAADGRLTRRAERDVAPFVYAGAAILRPELFKGAPTGPSRSPRCSTAPLQPAGCMGCGSKASGCMSERRTRSREAEAAIKASVG